MAQIAEQLPRRGDEVGVVGCGSSFYIAQSYASCRETQGYGATDAFPASIAPTRSWDVMLAVSRPGTTTEVIEPAEAALRARSHFVLAGAGWTHGIANEAALKLREMAACWSESYPALEDRHRKLKAMREDS